MSEAERFWDDVYRRGPAEGGKPHPYLVEALNGAEAGTALDLGCGDGANAIWLASNGWTVTGVDISQVALDKAAARAARAGVDSRVHWERADVRDWSRREAFDLVAELFVHTASDVDRSSIRARAAECVRPGGTLLVIAHYTLAPWVRNPNTSGLPSAGEIVADLALSEPEWTIRRADQIPRLVRHQGIEATVLDAVVHAVRAPGDLPRV